MAAGAIAAAALTSVSLRSVLAWASRPYLRGAIRGYRPAHSKLNRCLSDRRCYARLYRWRLHHRAVAYKMGRRAYARSLFSRHCSWLFGMGICHGTQRCVFGCSGQQYCWRRIIRGPATRGGTGGPVDYYVDALLRPNPTASPNTTGSEAMRREIARSSQPAFLTAMSLRLIAHIWRKSSRPAQGLVRGRRQAGSGGHQPGKD